jgi:bifunctional glutamyl/prolyl-tRNA synthetase
LIDEADAATIKENEMVTFMDWGNVKINKIHTHADGRVREIDAELNLENKDYKKTVKVTWLANTPSNAPFTPVKCYHFDHIIAKAVLDKDEDFKQYCEHQTEFVFDVLGDNEMRNIKKGDIIQLSRRGYYICDEAFTPDNNGSQNGVLSGRPLVLFNIPEGNKRESPTSYMSTTNQKYKTVEMAEEAELKAAQAKSEPKENKKSAGNKAVAAAATPSAALPANVDLVQVQLLNTQIKEKGESVRNLKTAKAAKVIFVLFYYNTETFKSLNTIKFEGTS